MPTIGNSEIHALQYAVCMYINILDRVLWSRLQGWNTNNSGLNMEVAQRHSKNDMDVRIFPVGWPQGSLIHARFSGSDKGGWDFWEGHVEALHLRTETGEPFRVFFQMRHSGRWDNISFHCFANGGANQFKQAAKDEGFTVRD